MPACGAELSATKLHGASFLHRLGEGVSLDGLQELLLFDARRLAVTLGSERQVEGGHVGAAVVVRLSPVLSRTAAERCDQVLGLELLRGHALTTGQPGRTPEESASYKYTSQASIHFGVTHGMGRPKIPYKERFDAKVDRRGPDECWPWLAQRMPNGYARFGQEVASRAAWKIYRGVIPDGQCVLHTCDGGSRGCVNPKHLYLGTRLKNSQDMANRKRQRTGERKLSETDVIQIRLALFNGAKILDLALQFGVHILTISRIRSGRTWKGVGVDVPPIQRNRPVDPSV